MDAINSSDESDYDIISTEMLENIRDVSQTHPNVNIREARYKIRDSIVKSYANQGERFTKGIFDCCKRDFARIDTFGRIWFRSFPFHSRTKKLC